VKKIVTVAAAFPSIGISAAAALAHHIIATTLAQAALLLSGTVYKVLEDRSNICGLLDTYLGTIHSNWKTLEAPQYCGLTLGDVAGSFAKIPLNKQITAIAELEGKAIELTKKKPKPEQRVASCNEVTMQLHAQFARGGEVVHLAAELYSEKLPQFGVK
jgi:hypothetical protein